MDAWTEIDNTGSAGFCDLFVNVPWQPANVITSIYMFALGTVGFFRCSSQVGQVKGGLAMLALTGIGSAVYHATSFRGAGMLDSGGMVVALLTLTASAAFELTSENRAVHKQLFKGALDTAGIAGFVSQVVAGALGLMAISFAAVAPTSFFFTIFFAAPVVVLLILLIIIACRMQRVLSDETLENEVRQLLYTAIAYVGVGAICQVISVSFPCTPFVGACHSIWHVLVSGAVYNVSIMLVILAADNYNLQAQLLPLACCKLPDWLALQLWPGVDWVKKSDSRSFLTGRDAGADIESGGGAKADDKAVAKAKKSATVAIAPDVDAKASPDDEDGTEVEELDDESKKAL
eukprot:PLAT7831.1.p1 GENE.PLAT7831.1~~PLAT7831.1.p1  ORF type:complete len:347 (+),score=163.53 PLAT7831.1:170-1210(+)